MIYNAFTILFYHILKLLALYVVHDCVGAIVAMIIW